MRTRNILVLGWWLLLFTCLQISALILDRFHHLEWGRMGIHMIKTCYLAFACVLLARYRSFRSQKAFENMVESYNRVAKTVFEAETVRKDSWVNPFLNLVLVVLASIDFTLVFQWNEPVFKTSVWLDFIIWALILRWLGRTFWLKTKGTRERLKEGLDDARSRMRNQDAEPRVVEAAVSKTPFTALTLVSLAVAFAISFERWHEVRNVFRIDNLKACMETCMRKASYRFYNQGELQIDVAGEPCVLERQGQVELSLDFHGGELHLRAVENDSVDYFGNENRGDEGLVLDATGRFRKAWSNPGQDGLK
ncbi:MAG TPA: hypothetical protein VJ385_20525 [Fibrobacteria bacterium]|nr:hypothetical protein [Fibrobacteria bacterium]